jgi:hypothetical protein
MAVGRESRSLQSMSMILPTLVLTKLKIKATWQYRVERNGARLIKWFSASKIVAYHREGINVDTIFGSVHVDTGGWYLDSPSSFSVIEGGVDKSYVKIRAVQGFGVLRCVQRPAVRTLLQQIHHRPYASCVGQD